MDAGLLQPVSRLRRWSQSECSRSRAVRCDPTRGAYCGDGRALPAELLTPLDASAVETLIFATAGISAAMSRNGPCLRTTAGRMIYRIRAQCWPLHGRANREMSADAGRVDVQRDDFTVLFQ